MPLPFAGAVDIDDLYLVRTDKTLDQNVLKFAWRGLLLGTTYSVLTYRNVTYPLPLWSAISRGLFCHALPGAFYGAVFAGTTCVLDEVRGRVKGVSNAAIGGALTGMCIGSRSMQPWVCFRATVYTGVFAGLVRFLLTFERSMEKQHPMSDVDRLREDVNMNFVKHLGPQP